MIIPDPEKGKKRVVIVGGGFAGLRLARKLDNHLFQIVLVDRNNYHQFPPLLYQVASSGLEVSSICFPFRRIFDKKKDCYFKLAEVTSISPEKKEIKTDIGIITYDYLVIASGTTTNYYGNSNMERLALPMKNAEEALVLKNSILLNMEKAVNCTDLAEKRALLTLAVVGGGATGVEISGALAEMKKHIIPKDYPEINPSEFKIYLIEGTSKLLGALSLESSRKSQKFLEEMGVEILLNKKVVDYDGVSMSFDDGGKIATKTLIWVSGVTVPYLEGVPKESVGKGGRIIVDELNRIKGMSDIFVIGDAALQREKNFPDGHPQVAPVAVQQGKLLVHNMKALATGQPLKVFEYEDNGNLATVGKNKAVADINNVHLSGFIAWVVWLVVHLRSIFGVKNKLIVLIDWTWSYFTQNQSLRLIYYIPRKNDCDPAP